MSLDEELRSAFAQQARSRVAPPPDPDGLIRGGRSRRRRRTLRRAAVGVAAAVLVGAGGYGVLSASDAGEPDVASPPSGTPTSATPSWMGPAQLAAGAYRLLVGADATGRRIEADFAVDGATWSGGSFPLVVDQSGSVYAGIGIYQPRALAAGSGCSDDATTTRLGRSPRRLAAQLATLPRSTVLEAPAPMLAFGHDGVHLRLRIDVDCPSYYRVATTRRGDRGVTYAPPGTAVTDVFIDFWVLDVGGAVVVVDQWNDADASIDLVAHATRARESIVLRTRE